MKRNLAWGLAALACGSAAAQSNVNVYGLVDMNLGIIDKLSDNAGAAGGNTVRVNSGGMNTSRLGFTGSEDLGGGLKALFQLEMGIAADTGVADTPLFKRQATVGLEGRYGTLLLGRAFTTVYDFVLPYDPMGYAPQYSWAPAGSATGASKYGMTFAFDNLVKYAGKTGNLSYGASYGAGEGSSGGDGAKGAVAVNYAAGPWSAVATYERINGLPDAATGARGATTAWHLGAMYSEGKLKLQAAMRDFRQEVPGSPDLRGTLYWAGSNYKVTPAVTLAGVVYYQDVRHGAQEADPVMVVGRVRYALSRRTDLYVTAAYAKAKHGALAGLARDEAGYGNRQKSVLAGIQHRF
ncbi:porin [Massilia dura]|uniref:Porin n=1 Tax=Pseudoduganella dura TaxID=321982 RepID=A0A6I3XU42_9BURK|nr:porin [Pseudoduganella dura]MUI15998.1 porin [Pseudoduganella dura]GGX95109.1 porin [Pseudoduganella dura]